MIILRLIPILLSALLLSAHFLRADFMSLVILSLLFPTLLFFPRAWAARIIQVILVLGASEWVRTLVGLVALRQQQAQSWARLAIILGLVAAFTGASALVFYFPTLKTRYRLKTLNILVKSE